MIILINYTTGDLLKSEAEVLVNTVNCEGYMGKGIAYQFKLQFPENNKDYIRSCKSGELTVGKLHYFYENGKYIVNFPTKNKWREKSKIEYISEGLDQLVKLIGEKQFKSIAIPPLGSGNGGLNWSEVKLLIENKLSKISNNLNILVYEPSKNYSSKPIIEPKLNFSSLILMQMKLKLNKFDNTRLQKTAYFFNIFSGTNYFKFVKHRFGPYDNSIKIISKDIKAYQEFHNVKNTKEAYEILMNKLISANVEDNLSKFKPAIDKATSLVNNVNTNNELECMATIVFLLENESNLTDVELLKRFKSWSKDKAERFTDEQILYVLDKLCKIKILEQNLIGYEISHTL